MQGVRLFTIGQVLERTGDSRATLYRKLAEGKIAAVKDRGRTKVSEAEVQRYIASLPPAEFRTPPRKVA
jgi:excisionase family DNA binding protein